MRSEIQQIYGASEQEVKVAMEGYGVQIPDDVLFSENDNGTYEFRANMLQQENYVLDGILTCDLYSGGRIGRLDNKIKKAELYKEFPVISESEAYQRICNGRFRDLRAPNCMSYAVCAHLTKLPCIHSWWSHISVAWEFRNDITQIGCRKSLGDCK